jgi:hypothetical protein
MTRDELVNAIDSPTVKALSDIFLHRGRIEKPYGELVVDVLWPSIQRSSAESEPVGWRIRNARPDPSDFENFDGRQGWRYYDGSDRPRFFDETNLIYEPVFVAQPQASAVSEPAAWPSREVIAREIRRAMLDNPTEESFNKRAEAREAIANVYADIIIERFAASRHVFEPAGATEPQTLKDSDFIASLIRDHIKLHGAPKGVTIRVEGCLEAAQAILALRGQSHADSSPQTANIDAEVAVQLVEALNDMEISAYNAAKYRIGRALGLLTSNARSQAESEHTRNLANALCMQEAAEEAHANCTECDGEDVPELCPKCFPLFDEARVERRRLLSALNVPQASAVSEQAYDKLSRAELVRYFRTEEYADEIADIIDNFPPSESHACADRWNGPSPEPGDCPFNECQHPEECKPICAFAPCRKQRLSERALTRPQ